MKALIKAKLIELNIADLATAREMLYGDRWHGFWESIAAEWINQQILAAEAAGMSNNYAPEETWKKAWDQLERLHPEYILEKLTDIEL